MCTGHALGRQRDLLGHGPQKRPQFPRAGANDLVGLFPSGASLAVAVAASSLRLPTAIVDRLGALLQASWQQPADCGGGSREAPAPSPRARRAWLWPVWGRPPGGRRSPVASSEG